MPKSLYEKFDKPPERSVSSHRPVFERFEYFITGPLKLIFKPLETNMCTQPKGPRGKSKALETALNNKLLGTHEHLKEDPFSPTAPVQRTV